MQIGKVWLYRLLFCVCVCVCTVTDFFAEDKASGVKFCTVFHQRPRQGITHGELCSPEAKNQKPKIGWIGQRVGRFVQRVGGHVWIEVSHHRHTCPTVFRCLHYRGFQAYLSTAPDYDFLTYRQMVHEITQTFSLLSQQIIEIRNKLSKYESLTNLAACINNVQALEQTKLEQVSSLPHQSDVPHLFVKCYSFALNDTIFVKLKGKNT